MTKDNNNNTSANNSFAAALVGQLEKDMTEYLNAFVDHAAFASQMETANGVNKVVARNEYDLANECQGAWISTFGNTTDISFVPEENQQMENRTRFCSRLNVLYWENRMLEYMRHHPEVNPSAPEYSKTHAAEDLDWANIYVNHHEAKLNHRRMQAKLTMLLNFYEKLIGKPYAYVPYVVKASTTAKKANAALAQALLDVA
jgi:hypothetical protein